RLLTEIVETTGGTLRGDAEAQLNRLRPGHARELARRGEDAFARGDFQEAIELIVRAEKLGLEDPAIAAKKRQAGFELSLQLCKESLNAGYYQEALQIANDARGLHQTDPRITELAEDAQTAMDYAEIRRIPGPKPHVGHLAFRRKDGRLVSQSVSGIIQVW